MQLKIRKIPPKKEKKKKSWVTKEGKIGIHSGFST